MTLHEKTKHNAPKIIFELRWPLPTTMYNLWTSAPTNLKSSSHAVTEIYAKIHPDRPYSTFAENAMKCITFVARWSPYTHRLSINVDHAHKIRRVPWPLKARTRAVTNVLVKKKHKASVSRDRQYTKSKKEVHVAGDVFTCSCFCNHSNCSV